MKTDVMAELPAVRTILRDTLQLGARAEAFDERTLLLGHLPELDSMAVVAVLTAMEEHYGIAVDDGDISAQVFESVGSLTRFIESKLAG
jgi:acyl carrier protein